MHAPATPVSRPWYRRSNTPGRRRLSLRRGMIVLLVLALLPITILAILQGIVRMENRRAAVVRQLSENAESLADSNQTILRTTEAMLRVIAMNPVVRAGETGCADQLIAARKLSPINANLIRYDAGGRLLCAAIAPAQDYVIPDRAYWDSIRRSDRALVSDAVWGPFSKRPILALAVPLRDAAGNFDGTMNASIDLKWLGDRLRVRVAGEDTGVAVISDSGQLLMESRPLPRFDPATPPGTIGEAKDEDGARWSYTVVPLVRAGPYQNGLHVVYASPVPPRFGLVWWQTIVDFVLPVLAIVMASGAIWIGTERLVLRWLIALQGMALQYAAGNYRRRAINFTEAPREIRSVAASLYRMSGAIGERDDRLHEAIERQRLLTREVHHRVKNNFQVVMSLLSLQSSRLADTDARRAIDQARRRISALALVHRLLYDGGELVTVTSRDLLTALCEQLQPRGGGLGPVLVVDHVADIPLDIDSAVPFTLWVVETVNNALHHGFPPPAAGKVRVALTVDDGVDGGVDGDMATLSVIDDGVGFDCDAAAGEAAGYGLRLVRALAGQLGGTASLRAGADGGSEARLVFPQRTAAQVRAAQVQDTEVV